MAIYEEPLGKDTPEWPYPVHYDRESEVSTDVLILGGGLAGCNAAISATNRGAKVVVVDKAPVIRSGSGGGGIDHWHDTCTNPCCKVTPEEMMALEAGQVGGGSGFSTGHASYITCRESYDALLEAEKMGIKIRDEDDEFAGAEFRDEETKLLFAYDYDNCHTIRIQGADLKPALYKEVKRLGVEIFERVMVTGLLTEEGEQGSRVVGASGVNVRTGEFYIFKAKATLLATAQPSRLWAFSTELVGSNAEHADPNCVGDGHAMAWQAGAEFTLMEKSTITGGPFRYPAYGVGNWHNTWYACTIVDANGKEVPWIDRDGKVLKTVEERYRPAPGQRMFTVGPNAGSYELRAPSLIPDLHERIKKGEYVLPLYADLPAMPEHERRAIFGLMVCHEGKTRIPIYENYTQAGFDPAKDLLQANVMPPDAYRFGDWFQARGVGAPQWRTAIGGGLVTDWDLKTNLEGLFTAGAVARVGGCAGASTTGRYAGRKVAEYVKSATAPAIDRKQVDEEKRRIYAHVNQRSDVGWKELYAGISRIMQDYCGEYKNEDTLKTGLEWLNSIRESEGSKAFARNPHELMRVLECLSRITVGEIIMHASLARKASSMPLDFKRLDYPDMDPPAWQKFITTRLEKGEVKVGELPHKYWLLPPYAPTYKENYERHCGL
ncbi:MAG: FAD-binding protein [Deltaproteobacteria bacterium]|nr:FAD-binding protein [Deltaproteobacteria bacterium]